MQRRNNRIQRELRTASLMIGLYCSNHHNTDSNLCRDCAELLEYAKCRLGKCPYGESKPACSKCPIHCYQPDMREFMRKVMRYSGPRMIYRHPVLAILHLLDSRKEPPERAGASKMKKEEKENKNE